MVDQKVKINDLILYKEEVHKIVWIYNSGFVEIQKHDTSNIPSIKLVDKKEISPLLKEL